MPVVRIDMFGGRSLEKKRELARDITRAVARVLEVTPDGVHVLFEEKARENWARGAILNVDRNPALATSTREAWLAFIHLEGGQKAGDLSQGFEAARSAVPGACKGIVKVRSSTDTSSLAITTWESREAWISSPLARMCAATGAEVNEGAPVALPATGGLLGLPRVSRFMTMSTHTVMPSAVDEYLELRRIAVNPGMARLTGFVSSDIVRRADLENAFFVVNQWTAKRWSDEYSQSPLHAELRPKVRALLDSHSGMREYLVEPLNQLDEKPVEGSAD